MTGQSQEHIDDIVARFRLRTGSQAGRSQITISTSALRKIRYVRNSWTLQILLPDSKKRFLQLREFYHSIGAKKRQRTQ
jgi:hypothetical protein